MKPSDVMGIVFPSTHDNYLGDMTTLRSIGSVPFCGRFRLIDFTLSNFVNAGITKVGVITKENFQSLLDHLGTGRSWDLARRNGGLRVFTPYSTPDAGVYHGKIDALAGAIRYLENSTEEYVMLADANLVSNINLEDVVGKHIESGADFTVLYKTGMLPRNDQDIMVFKWDKDGFATEVSLPFDRKVCDYSLETMIVRRSLLVELVKKAHALGKTDLAAGIIQQEFKNLKIFGYKVDDFAVVIDDKSTYYEASMQLLSDPEARRSLFCPDRPIYTKVRGDMPTKYGLESRVSNSLIADGCVIDGEVKNCIVFRGVKIESGAKLENCILMQDTVIGAGCDISNAIFDKNVTVVGGNSFYGAKSHPIYIPKGETV